MLTIKLKNITDPQVNNDVAAKFGISKTSAYQRCKKFRNKMDTHITTKLKVMNATRVKLEFMVPDDKFDLFTNMLQQIKNILKP